MPSLVRVLLATFVCTLTSSRASATEPQVTFSLTDGWIGILVSHKGKPVADVKVRVVDTSGQTIAEGECDDQGQGSFPAPTTPTVLLALGIPGKKEEADIIVLRRQGAMLRPNHVQLSFSKPCCRVVREPVPAPEKANDEAPSSIPVEVPFLATGGIFLIAGALVFLWRPRSMALTGIRRNQE